MSDEISATILQQLTLYTVNLPTKIYVSQVLRKHGTMLNGALENTDNGLKMLIIGSFVQISKIFIY